jgi:TonB family protein
MAHSAPHSFAPAQGFVSPALSQRALTFGAIVAFHVVLIYLFASGLGAATLQVVTTTLIGTVIDPPPAPPEPPPPAPQPDLESARVDINLGPPPDVRINIPSDDSGAALSGVLTPDLPPVIEAPPSRVEPIHLVGHHQLPNTQDYYPAPLIRDGIEGATNIQVCVDERGRRQGDPTVTQTSGNARLDRAALDVARDGRYARSARGETFVPNCYGFRIVFKVTK